MKKIRYLRPEYHLDQNVWHALKIHPLLLVVEGDGLVGLLGLEGFYGWFSRCSNFLFECMQSACKLLVNDGNWQRVWFDEPVKNILLFTLWRDWKIFDKRGHRGHRFLPGLFDEVVALILLIHYASNISKMTF